MLSWIKLGDYTEALIHVVTFGFGEKIALAIARLFGKNSCGCCERKQWLNRLTDKSYNGFCGGLHI
jgi:hypothetical protein